VSDVTAIAVALNETEVLPAGTVIVDGTVMDVFDAVNATLAPPAGAGWARVTEHDVVAGATSPVLVQVNEFSRLGVSTVIAAPVTSIAIAFASRDAPRVSPKESGICDPETVADVSCTVAVATTPSVIVPVFIPLTTHVVDPEVG
jgi:hypothetical protein